jgi:hypothetical protein
VQGASATATGGGSIYDAAPALAPAPAAAAAAGGGFTFVPGAEVPDITLTPVPVASIPTMMPAPATVVPAAATSASSGNSGSGFSFINTGGELTPGGTVLAAQQTAAAAAPAPSPPSIYDAPPVVPQAAAVQGSVFNRRVGDSAAQVVQSQVVAPAPAAAGFTFAPGQWELPPVSANEEKRCDPADGRFYSKKEFIDAYGSTAQWDAASPM